MHRTPLIHFIGIGAQKAATSWIAECLREHPELYVSPGKEVHFFSTDALYGEGMDTYYNYFKEAPLQKKIGEFSTTYLSSADAPVRIHKYVPSVKLIVSLRNPVDRALSHIEHLISRGVFSRGISAEDAVSKRRDIVEHGMYGAALQRYFALFSRSQMHVVFYEDIQKNPEVVMRKLYAYLDVDEAFTPASLRQKFNTAEIRSSEVYRAVNKIHFVLMRSSLGGVLKTILKTLGITSQRVVKTLHALHPKRDYTSSRDRVFLQNLFLEDIALLEVLLARDLSHWKNHSP